MTASPTSLRGKRRVVALPMMWCRKSELLNTSPPQGQYVNAAAPSGKKGSVSSTHRRRQRGRSRASTDMKSHDNMMERTSDGSEAASARMSPPGLTAVAPPGSVRLVVGSSTAPSLPVLPAPADGETDFKGFFYTKIAIWQRAASGRVVRRAIAASVACAAEQEKGVSQIL